MRDDLWTQEDIDLLMRDYPVKRTKDVAEALGRSVRACNVMAYKLGLKKDHYGIVLTDKQKDYLVRHFKDTDNEYLAIMLGISQTTLHRYARRWGLRKSKAHVKRMQMECVAIWRRLGLVTTRQEYMRIGEHKKKGREGNKQNPLPEVSVID